jgi:hypothetical protein
MAALFAALTVMYWLAVSTFAAATQRFHISALWIWVALLVLFLALTEGWRQLVMRLRK